MEGEDRPIIRSHQHDAGHAGDAVALVKRPFRIQEGGQGATMARDDLRACLLSSPADQRQAIFCETLQHPKPIRQDLSAGRAIWGKEEQGARNPGPFSWIAGPRD